MSFNPLVESMDNLTDSEISAKMADLSKRYFQTKNPQAQQQIAVFLDMFREEQTMRMYRQQQADNDSDDPNLDNLININ
jgi:hypothetical protein